MDFAKVERVLIYRLGSLGDTVVALPALHLIERAFPHAHRIYLTNIPIQSKAPPAEAILRDSGLVHGYMAYPVGTRSPRELISLASQIHRFAPQVVVYLMAPRGEPAVRRDAWFFRLCGVRQIIGLPFANLAENRFDPASGLWESEASRLLRCIRPLGTSDVSDLSNWDLRLTAAEWSRASQELAPLQNTPFILVAIGGKIQVTDWGTDNWRSLLQRLTQQLPDHALVMAGAQEDHAASELASFPWQGKVLNLSGRLSPRETAAVAARAALFLGRDSGPKFLAAIQGVPCAIVYSARNPPGVWFPPGAGHRNLYRTVDCARCGLETCVEQQKKCIAGITVDEMLVAAMEAFKTGAAIRPPRPDIAPPPPPANRP
jgi:heptosyltransferase-3